MVADDRGQVLLIGGLAVAIVFLTAIPLSNSLVVSESASTSETVADIDRAAERELSVERALYTLVSASEDRDFDSLNESVQDFSTYYKRVSGQQDGVYVNATVDVSVSKGYITTQSSEDKYKSPGGNANGWDLTTDADEIAVFDMRVTDTEGVPESQAFRIRVTGQSGSREILAVGDNSGSGPQVVDIRDSSGTICSGQEVELDLLEGTCEGTTSGSFQPITEGLSGPYTVEFENGQKADGTYRFASTGTFPESSYDDDDYDRYGVQPAFNVTYVGPDTSYNRIILVSETS